MFKKLILFYFLFLNFFPLSAEIVKDIQVIGNKRITAETIKVFSTVKISDDISEKNLNDILKNLYETDFFNDVSLSFKNNILTINVVENKIIQSVFINGIKNKDLIKSINELIKTNEKKSYVKSNIEKDKNNIANYLKILGYHFSKIDTKINDNLNNTVDLIYNINLGDKALIKKINFTGDKVYKNNILRNVIISEESKFWKLISNKKYLIENQIQLDERLLKNFYLNNGYYNVNITKTSANLLEKNYFNLTYNINAGQKFFFNDLNLSLPPDYDPKNFNEITSLLTKYKGTYYSQNKIKSILDVINKIASSSEYEFINAKFEENIINENQLNINFLVEDSEKYYVNRIDIIGNDITNESAIRDLLSVDEGDPLNVILNNESINNIKSTGIFSNVELKIFDSNLNNKKDVQLKLTEQPSGEITAAAGYGSNGQTISFGIKENNFRGNLTKLDTSLSISSNSIKGGINLLVPNYLNSDKYLRFNLSRTDQDNFDTAGYKNSITNLTLGTSYEHKENLFFTPLIQFELEDLETNTFASNILKTQDGNYFDLNFDYSFLYDKRNQIFQPSEGFFSKFNQSIPIITNNFSLLNNYDFKYYKELNEDMVGSFSFFASSINTLKKDEDVRVSDRITIPVKKLRGFEKGKIGPKDNNDFIGGNYASGISFASTLPKFLSNLEEVEFGIFLDAANLWGVDYNSSLDRNNKIRTSTGITIDWLTPIGPLNFVISQPLSKNSTDKVESFSFNIGTTF